MRAENMPKIVYGVVKSPQFSPFIKKIVVAEHDSEGSFYTGSRIGDISAHAH